MNLSRAKTKKFKRAEQIYGTSLLSGSFAIFIVCCFVFSDIKTNIGMITFGGSVCGLVLLYGLLCNKIYKTWYLKNKDNE